MQPKKSLLFPLLLVFYEITVYLSNDMYLPALPQIATDLGITHSQVQLSLTSWFFGSMSLQLILGPLSDRYGRRPIVLTSGILFIISTILCTSTSDIISLSIARFVEGTGVCAIITAGYASIHELYDRTHAIRILALMGSIVVIAPTFGPLFGSGVLFFANWHWIFWGIAALGVITVSLLFKFMPETNPVREPLSAASLIQHYWGVLTNPNFITFTLTFCLIFCNFIVWLAAAPFIVSDQFGFDTAIFGIAQVSIFIFFIIANRLVKYFMNKLGVNKLINLGLCIAFCAAIVIVSSAAWLPKFLIGVIVGMMLYAFGAGLAFAPLSRLAVDECIEPMGVRMAVFSTGMNGFGMLGTLLSSAFYTGTLLSFAWIVFWVVILACAIYFGSRKRTRT